MCMSRLHKVLDNDGAAPVRVEDVEGTVTRAWLLALDGLGFVRGLEQGDIVSLHWDWVCDRLARSPLAWLRACTVANLNAVNTLAIPSPAATCEART
jgi:ribosomal protein S19E (S16A)